MPSKWLGFTLLIGIIAAWIGIYETWFNDFSSLNHYQTLGVSNDASTAEIRRAFRELSLKYHPDKSDTELNLKRFHQISYAYETLQSEDSRRNYDILLMQKEIYNKREQPSSPLFPFYLQWSPSSSKWDDVVKFYILQFPKEVYLFLYQMMDLRLFIMLLVLLGCFVFVLDIVLRILYKIYHFMFVRSSSISQDKLRRRNEDALKAARLRQQQALDEKVQSRLVKRKP